MAEATTVWGIDIGQAGLKALQLRYNEASGQVIAVGFDFIQHPKILSQPDAIPAELINEALKTFVTRNAASLKGSLIGFVVPSNTSIVKFIQLPPVEASKVGDIVKYEARQQIPFDLNDVIWDWQTMGGGIQEGGYMLDSEVGLVAMKKEALQNHLKPFNDLRVEIDTIQATPLAMFNFMSFDQFGQRPGEPVTERDGYTVLLDMGADTTTMLVSNGRKIWQRNISIGGNQFTRALTKDMKLTFAKSEHLKCNATKAPDPKAVFQALRPVFNDYVSEIQRSIGFFSSVNREAKIEKILAVGNGFKLAGLQKFLQQNLQYDVERVENYKGLVGDAVMSQPLFQENAMSFAVAYGVALQMLQQTSIRTSLLPPEIRTARMIRRKKPWALVTAAMLLLGLCMSVMGYANSLSTVRIEKWGKSESKVKDAKDESGRLKSEYETEDGKNKALRKSGDELVARAVGRTHWLEVYKAINACLPQEGETADKGESVRQRIRLYGITCKEVPDLKVWFDDLKAQYPTCTDEMDATDKGTPPSGAGYVFTLQGLHYNKGRDQFMFDNFLKRLQQWEVVQRLQGGEELVVPVGKIGISHALSTHSLKTEKDFYPNGLPSGMTAGTMGYGTAPGGGAAGMRGGAGYPTGVNSAAMAGMAGRGGRGGAGRGPGGAGQPVDPLNDVKVEKIDQTDFEVMFVWKETPESARLATKPVAGATTGTTPAAGASATTPAAAGPGAPATTPPAVAAPGAPGTTPMPMPPGAAVPAVPAPGVNPGNVPGAQQPPPAAPANGIQPVAPAAGVPGANGVTPMPNPMPPAGAAAPGTPAGAASPGAAPPTGTPPAAPPATANPGG